jgi:hypothetical protein
MYTYVHVCTYMYIHIIHYAVFYVFESSVHYSCLSEHATQVFSFKLHVLIFVKRVQEDRQITYVTVRRIRSTIVAV